MKIVNIISPDEVIESLKNGNEVLLIKLNNDLKTSNSRINYKYCSPLTKMVYEDIKKEIQEDDEKTIFLEVEYFEIVNKPENNKESETGDGQDNNYAE